MYIIWSNIEQCTQIQDMESCLVITIRQYDPLCSHGNYENIGRSTCLYQINKFEHVVMNEKKIPRIGRSLSRLRSSATYRACRTVRRHAGTGCRTRRRVVWELPSYRNTSPEIRKQNDYNLAPKFKVLLCLSNLRQHNFDKLLCDIFTSQHSSLQLARKNLNIFILLNTFMDSIQLQDVLQYDSTRSALCISQN